MGNRIQSLAQQLLEKPSVADCSIDELKHLVHRHPYFAPAQFLLLQKLKETTAPEMEAQARKAILYYHHPLQFENFISADFFDVATYVSKQKIEAAEVIKTGVTEIENDKIIDDPTVIEKDKTEEDFINTQNHLSINTASENDEGSPDVTEVINLPINKNAEHSNTADINILPLLAQDSIATESGQISEPEPLTTELTFEPYHMVDYFASQGIKFSAEELSKDKLGKQLKSFTDWLKTMKRFPLSGPSLMTETAAEKNIETMADSSVTNTDIITEAMAEVWAKQGAKEKAAETYEKLSLLYPSKKAFFAGKIANLNRY